MIILVLYIRIKKLFIHKIVVKKNSLKNFRNKLLDLCEPREGFCLSLVFIIYCKSNITAVPICNLVNPYKKNSFL